MTEPDDAGVYASTPLNDADPCPQLTSDDLARLTPAEIVEARQAGFLDTLMGRQPRTVGQARTEHPEHWEEAR